MTDNSKKIGTVIRSLREERGISARDMVELLVARGYSIKYPTYMGYESGNSMPNADMLLAICDILQVEDVLHAFGYGASMYPSYDSKSLLSHPWFFLVDEFCYAFNKDSRAVFDYFFSRRHAGNPARIFSRSRPSLPDESAVARILGIGSIDYLYSWGEETGNWSPAIIPTKEESEFLRKHRELSASEAPPAHVAG